MYNQSTLSKIVTQYCLPMAMLDYLINSKTRVRLLLKFFSNKHTSAYLRSLAQEFNESSNSVRVELNRLADAGLLQAKNEGNTKLYKANDNHPLFPELNQMVIKYLGLSGIIENVLERLGTVKLAFVTGDYARGVDSGIVDLVVVGDIDWNYLLKLIAKAEEQTERKIRPLVLTVNEFDQHRKSLDIDNALVLWTEEGQDQHNGVIPENLRNEGH